MHAGEFQQGGDAVEEAQQDEPVQGSGVTNLGEIRPGIQTDGGEGQDGGDSKTDAVAGGLAVDPEGHPREDHDEDAGDVDLDEEVAGVALEVEGDLQYRKFSWKSGCR